MKKKKNSTYVLSFPYLILTNSWSDALSSIRKKSVIFLRLASCFQRKRKKKKEIITSVDGKAKAERGQENCSVELEKDHMADYHSSNLITSPVSLRAD